MKLYLFWWAEEWQAAHECHMIQEIIKKINPKQLLHIPFARTKDGSREEWNGDRFHRHIDLWSIQYLNANNPEDIAKANNPVIFISGGREHENLINNINKNPKLLEIIRNAEHIIGESTWSKVLGTHYASEDNNGNIILLQSLGIIQNTILEWHYTQRNKEPKLNQAIQQTEATYGVGIDSCTAMVFDLKDFPQKYETIGDGNVCIKK